jgi:hypothetical protein
MAAPVTIRIPISCGGEVHEAELTRDGELRLLNHPSIEMMQSFIAFGAKKPPCLEGWEVWKKTPTSAILDIIEDRELQNRIRTHLARDFAHRACEVATTRGFASDAKLPFESIEIVDKYLFLDVLWPKIDDLIFEQSRLTGALGRRAWTPTHLAEAALNAVYATKFMWRKYSNDNETEEARRHAATAVAVYSSDKLRPDFRPKGHHQAAALYRDPEFIRGYEKHAQEQRRHVARVLYAHLEGKPWPSF